MIPYSPEELVEIAEREFAWCEAEMKKASKEMGFGDDWKAVFLWKSLYESGVFVNVAIHPAVSPGGALLRTSVMASHERATLDEALAVFARAKRAFEAEHGPLPSAA